MNKAKGGGASAAAGAFAGQLGQLLGRLVLGGLSGVGLVWTLTALWPPSRSYVRGFGHQLQLLSHDYPAVVLGLLGGTLVTLLWQSLRK
jgi:hypothetical protein